MAEKKHIRHTDKQIRGRLDKRTIKAISFLEAHLITEEEIAEQIKFKKKLDRDAYRERIKLYKGLFLASLFGVAAFYALAVLSPSTIEGLAEMQNGRMYVAQAYEVEQTHQALTNIDYEKIPVNIRQSTVNLNPGSGTLLDLIQNKSTNSTYAVIMSANHVDSAHRDIDYPDIKISTNEDQTSFRSTQVEWVQYNDRDFGLGIYKIDGIINPNSQFAPFSLNKILSPSQAYLLGQSLTSFGFPGLPGGFSTLKDNNQYVPTTLTNPIFLDNGSIETYGQIAGGMSGGPTFTKDGNIIAINIDFIWDGKNILRPNSSKSFIEPVPSDFGDFYKNVVQNFKTKVGLTK